MPNSKSAEKRLLQNKTRRAQNRSIKSAVRTQVKKVRSAVDAGEIAKAEEEFKLAAKKLDKASSRNIIHKNAAARGKSRLQKLIKKAKNPAATTSADS